MSLEIEVPDSLILRITNAACEKYGWTAESGKTKSQFLTSVVKHLLVEMMAQAEMQQAAATASEAKRQEIIAETTEYVNS